MKVAVVGAGPAGAAAAIELALAGANVRIFERSAWPRAKTCGDGVTPDGLRVMDELGVALPPDAIACPDATVVAPGGARAVGKWNGIATVLPRIAFDAALVARAIRAGAAFADRTAVTSVEPDGTVATASARERYDAVILAEGATGGLAGRLDFGGFGERQVAIRGYARANVDLVPTYNVVYDKALVPGYAWVFPVDRRLANVGVCVPERAAKAAGGVRALLTAWLARDPRVHALFGSAPALEDLRGGVIPTGRRLRRADRVYAVGDAAGVADPLSAEGISQALVTGRAAAREILGAPGVFERSLRDHDRNAREARRLRTLFRFTLDPMIALARHRPALADHLVASGFTLKTNGHWFHGVRGALLR